MLLAVCVRRRRILGKVLIARQRIGKIGDVYRPRIGDLFRRAAAYEQRMAAEGEDSLLPDGDRRNIDLDRCQRSLGSSGR